MTAVMVMANDQTRDLGLRIRDLRERRGMTQGQLAYLAKVKQTWLSNVEIGESPAPQSDRLMRVAEILHTTVEYLLTGYDVPGLDPEAAALAREITQLPPAARGPIKDFIHSLGKLITQTDASNDQATEQPNHVGGNGHKEQQQPM